MNNNVLIIIEKKKNFNTIFYQLNIVNKTTATSNYYNFENELDIINVLDILQVANNINNNELENFIDLMFELEINELISLGF